MIQTLNNLTDQFTNVFFITLNIEKKIYTLIKTPEN